MLGWMNHKLESKIVGRNITSLRYADDTILMEDSEEELKMMMKVTEESDKASLKLNIQKTKILGPSLNGKQTGKNGNSDRLYFLGLQNHCGWWL